MLPQFCLAAAPADQLWHSRTWPRIMPDGRGVTLNLFQLVDTGIRSAEARIIHGSIKGLNRTYSICLTLVNIKYDFFAGSFAFTFRRQVRMHIFFIRRGGRGLSWRNTSNRHRIDRYSMTSSHMHRHTLCDIALNRCITFVTTQSFQLRKRLNTS